MLQRLGYAALLIAVALVAAFYVSQDPLRDPLAIVPTDLLVKYIKDTAYHPEIAFRYLIEEHDAPIWIKGYENLKFARNDNEAERARKSAESLREMKERDATLPNLSKRELSEKYLAWLRGKDNATQEQIIQGFIRWPGQKSLLDDGRWPPAAR